MLHEKDDNGVVLHLKAALLDTSRQGKPLRDYIVLAFQQEEEHAGVVLVLRDFAELLRVGEHRDGLAVEASFDGAGVGAGSRYRSCARAWDDHPLDRLQELPINTANGGRNTCICGSTAHRQTNLQIHSAVFRQIQNLIFSSIHNLSLLLKARQLSRTSNGVDRAETIFTRKPRSYRHRMIALQVRRTFLVAVEGCLSCVEHF